MWSKTIFWFVFRFWIIWLVSFFSSVYRLNIALCRTSKPIAGKPRPLTKIECDIKIDPLLQRAFLLLSCLENDLQKSSVSTISNFKKNLIVLSDYKMHTVKQTLRSFDKKQFLQLQFRFENKIWKNSCLYPLFWMFCKTLRRSMNDLRPGTLTNRSLKANVSSQIVCSSSFSRSCSQIYTPLKYFDKAFYAHLDR